MSWLSRFANVFRSDRVDCELDDELQFHLEERAADLIRRGMTPDAAAREARRQLGNRLRITESSREVKLLVWFESIVTDLRLGLRMLRKNAVVSAAAVLSLGLSIGACTAAFSLIDALILRTLPVPEPERLFQLSYPDRSHPGDEVESKGFGYPLFLRFRDAAGGSADLFGVSLGGGLQKAWFGGPVETQERVRAEWVSSDALPILGLRAAIGQTRLGYNERDAVDHPVAVLSYPFWMRRFGGSPDVLGRWVTIGDKRFQIVGVAQNGFTGLEPGYMTDLWLPLMSRVDASAFSAPDRTFFFIWGRLKRDASEQQVQQRLQAAFTSFRRDEAARIFNSETPRKLIPQLIAARLNLSPAGRGTSSLLRWQFQRPLLILGVVALLVLLIACSNVANLFMARAAAREREMAMRLSIGAGRARLIQQLLIESGILAGAASLLGLVFALAVAPQIVNWLAPVDYPAYLDLRIDARMLEFLAIDGAAATLLLGLAPALRASSVAPGQVLKTGSGNQSSRLGLFRLLIGAQVGFSFTVLFIAALLLLTFRNLTNVNLGFNKDGLVLANIASKDRLPVEREREAVPQTLDAVRQLPGVQAAGMSGTGLVGGPRAWVMMFPLRMPGHPLERPFFMEVSPGFFDTMQIPLVSGRDFQLADLKAGVPSVIVNLAFARRYFSGASPLGRQLTFEIDPKPLMPQSVEVVGVVGNAKYNNVREPAVPTIYAPLRRVAGMTLDIRTNTSPAILEGALNRALHRVHPSLEADGLTLQTTRIDSTLLGERLLAMLSGFFAAVAVALAAIGLYGVLSYSVVRRTKEIGIRIALGARQLSVVHVVVSDLLLVTVLGLIGGIGGGFALARFVKTLLFEVKPSDAATLALPLACLLLSMVLAAVAPALRAVRVDPMIALRYD